MAIPVENVELKSPVKVTHKGEILEISYWAAQDSETIQNCILDTDKDSPFPFPDSIAREDIVFYSAICEHIRTIKPDKFLE